MALRKADAEFEHLAVHAGDWITRAQDKLKALAAEREKEHADRMAGLPAGTCERCYGTGRDGGVSCPICNPVQPYAPGIPYEFYAATMENYREEPGNRAALVKARRFLEGTTDLYLTGGVGSGKTRLACSIANSAYAKGRRVRFIRVPLVLHQLQPGRDAEEIEQLEYQLFQTPILVLDDLGAERDQASDYTRRTLLMIYEERGDRGLRTIFTSNKSIQQLGEMQDDDRLASRIAGRADVVQLTTPDQRVTSRQR